MLKVKLTAIFCLIVIFVMAIWIENSVISLQNVYASNPANSIVGAIRWDAWVGDTNTDGLGQPYVGQQVEASLGPARYHYRLPFYAVETGPNSVQARCTTQAVMDQEIAYAKNAGIDYWAYVYYPSGSGLDTARNLYLNSAYKQDVKFCIIAEPGRFTSEAIDLFVTYFQMSNYQKVLSNRPLFYVFSSDANTSSRISELRSDCAAAGVADPYVVFMNMGGSVPSGVNAHSRYAQGGSGGQSWSAHVSAEESTWDSDKNAGRKVIPWVTTGWDKRTRHEHPVTWEADPGTDSWMEYASPNDIANELQDALNWNNNNPSAAEANAVLIYSWNEFDEGGWICPTLYYGADRLNAIANVLGGIQQATNNPPSSGTNLAAGKTASASSTYGTNYASKVVDGNVSTGWSANGETAGAWLQVDFGASTTFNKTILKADGYNRITGYKIQYYNGSSWVDLATDLWTTPYTPVTFGTCSASKVRIYVTSASTNPIVHEFEVYNSGAGGPQPVSEWRFDNNANDSIGSNHATAQNGAAYSASGKKNQAGLLDGINDYFSIPDSPSLEGMSQLTCAMWVKLDALPAGNDQILEKGNCYRINLDSSGHVHFAVATANNGWYTAGTNVTASTNLAAGSWFHIAGVYDGSYVKIYINGVLGGTGSQTISGNIVSNSNNMQFGKYYDANYMDGLIDEIRLYNTGLTAAQVQDLYNSY